MKVKNTVHAGIPSGRKSPYYRITRYYLFYLPLFLTLLQLRAVTVCKAQVSVVTQHNNNARTGWNSRETILNTTNVTTSGFGKVGTFLADDQIYAQPLVVSGLNIPNKGVHNVLYIATVNNTIYAYDADQTNPPLLLWKANFSGPNGVPPKNTDFPLACEGNYNDFSGNMGIVSTPVIDTLTATMYFLARTKENGSAFVQKLHAVSIMDGSEKPGSPVTISASIPGTGAGSVNGVITFDPKIHNQRSALALSRGVVYIAWASHCDYGPYHGWIMGYNASTLQQVFRYATTPGGIQAGIWMSGQGPAIDESGNLYVVTGNGTTGVSGNPRDVTNRGESILKLQPAGNTLNVASWFTPYNYQYLNDNDLDLGSSGPLLVPNTNLLVAGGKTGVAYVVNRDNMGGLSTTSSDNQIVQSITIADAGIRHLHGSTVYWSGQSGEYIYTWLESDNLKAFKFNRSTGKFDIPYSSTGTLKLSAGMPGGILSVSSNGTQPGTGIVWATHQYNGDANWQTRPGILHAYDATDLSKELWNSQQAFQRDDPGSFAKFNPPTIANGKVYCASFSNKLIVYGLITPGSVVFRTPENPSGTAQGLDYSYYNGTFNILPDFSKLIPVKTGTATDFNLANRTRNDSFAFQFKGYINIPADGYYTFYINSDDGSRLFIGDELVVDNDQRHAAEERWGSIGLKAGKHAITVGYFEYAGSEVFNVSYKGPSIPKQTIPASLLFRATPSATLRNPDNPANAVNGIDYNYYEGSFTALPDFSTLTPAASGTVSGFDISPKLRGDNFAFRFTGYVNVPADGIYTFYTTSNDGSKLYIGDQQIVDNDGAHTARERSGSIGLKAGKHAITVTFFEGSGTETLSVSYSGPSIPKQIIPATELYRVSSTSNLRNPENPSNTVNGLNYGYYEGNFTALPDFNAITPVKTGTINNFDIVTPRLRNDNFAFRFTGYVSIPADGFYTFYTNSNDGSKLFIGSQLIVDNDGSHAPRERSGTIGLKAGKHAITVTFFEGTGSESLTVSYSGPSVTKQAIPDLALYRINSAPALPARIVQDSIALSPMPVNDYLTISFQEEAGEITVSITDVASTDCLTQRVKVHNRQTEIYLGNLKSGYYLLHIEKGNVIISKPIIISR